MKKNSIGLIVASIVDAVAIAVILSASLSPVAGQESGNAGTAVAPRGAPHAPTPKTADGKPDLTGVWRPQPFSNDFTKVLAPGETMDMLPWAAKLTAARMSKDDPEANCLPAGVPRTAPYPWKIIQTPSVIVFLFEGNIHSYRQIFMDRKDHPKNLVDNPTWYGDSIGKWDKDTLVVDTTGFNDKTWFDFAGHPHTEQLHTIERYRRIDMETLEDRVTVIDPGAYTKPFTLLSVMPRLHEDLMEYICSENNRDVPHILGKDGVDKPVR